MRNLFNTLAAVAAGAAAMYYLDPERGRRRRALLRDKVVAASHDAGDFAGAKGKRAADHLKGALASGRSWLTSRSIDDAQQRERVRARLGRVVSHPGAIDVEVEQGCVCLSGQVLAHEVEALLSEVSSMPGVERIDSRLSVHRSAGNIPELQGSGGERVARH